VFPKFPQYGDTTPFIPAYFLAYLWLEKPTVKVLGGSKATRRLLAGASLGAAIFVSLIMLSPQTILLPFTNPAMKGVD
jgi:hypothetical protein